MMKKWRKPLLLFFVVAIATVSLAACNAAPENDVVSMTSTAKTENVVSATPDAQTTADVTVTDDATAEPSATGNATVKPASTQKPGASATVTKAPTATKTTAPTKNPTATPKKTPTATKKPTATKTPVKTATPKPTAQKEVYQTIEFEGKTYKVLMGRNGNPNLIKDYSTLPPILQAYAYPTFDKEAIMMDIYKYAKTKGFKYFSNPNVPLLKESSIGYNEYPEAFVPGGNMTEELAEEFSWYSPSLVTYLGDSAYTGDYECTELDDIISLREAGFSKINFLATDCDYLCLWIRDYGDSSYRKTYWDNGLYNGKVTKEYALYFMYGGRDDLVQEVKI